MIKLTKVLFLTFLSLFLTSSLFAETYRPKAQANPSQIETFCQKVTEKQILIQPKQKSSKEGAYFKCEMFYGLSKTHIGTANWQLYTTPFNETEAIFIINCNLDRQIKSKCLYPSIDPLGNYLVKTAFYIITSAPLNDPKAKSIINEIVKCGSTECRSKHFRYKNWDIYVTSMGSPVDWVKITFR